MGGTACKMRQSLAKREIHGPLRELTHDKIVASPASIRTTPSERFRHPDFFFAWCDELSHSECQLPNRAARTLASSCRWRVAMCTPSVDELPHAYSRIYARIDDDTAEHRSARGPGGRRRVLRRYECAPTSSSGAFRRPGPTALGTANRSWRAWRPWSWPWSPECGFERHDSDHRSERVAHVRLRAELDLFPGARDL
jgi:hypothetical protein